MKRQARLVLMGIACATSVRLEAVPGPGDTRVRQIDYVANQIVAVTATPGYQVTINFAPSEHIQTVAVGNAGAFQVTGSRGGNALFVKAMQEGVVTNMTVATDLRQYAFTLTAAATGETPAAYTIAFRYSRPVVVVQAPMKQVGSYKLGGSKYLWPSRISDDGEHISIDWPPNVDLPAIYALDGQGRESLTNGMMRGGHMVIDQIAPRLVFRLDRGMATATRFVPKAAQ